MCDDGSINAFKEVFGRKIRVVIDRLQVAKHYRSRLDTLRKHELKRLLQTQMSHIEGWNQGVKSSFDKFIDTLRNHWHEILNYFYHRQSKK